jgi:hypothetical protein
MSTSNFLSEIRNDISNDRLDAALQKLNPFLDDSPLLNEALQQSGRFAAIQKQIRLGMVSHEQSTLTINQIRAGILELVSEITELEESREDIKSEVTQAAASIQITQQAEKIYNIQQIDKADFS